MQCIYILYLGGFENGKLMETDENEGKNRRHICLIFSSLTRKLLSVGQEELNESRHISDWEVAFVCPDTTHRLIILDLS